jgi:hypothetical protein
MFSLTGGFVPIFGPLRGGLLAQPGGKIMSETTRLPNHLRPRREKVFGPARGIPLDGNAKARIKAFVQGYNARYRQEGQHHGPITRAFMDGLFYAKVRKTTGLGAGCPGLIWKFPGAIVLGGSGRRQDSASLKELDACATLENPQWRRTEVVRSSATPVRRRAPADFRTSCRGLVCGR